MTAGDAKCHGAIICQIKGSFTGHLYHRPTQNNLLYILQDNWFVFTTYKQGQCIFGKRTQLFNRRNEPGNIWLGLGYFFGREISLSLGRQPLTTMFTAFVLWWISFMAKRTNIFLIHIGSFLPFALEQIPTLLSIVYNDSITFGNYNDQSIFNYPAS